MRSKRIYLNIKKTKYCIVKLFSKKIDMQEYYKKYSQERCTDDDGFYKVLGVSLHYERLDKGKLSPETGLVLLTKEHCGAGIVSHELSHAVLYAYKHKKYKQQYPIVIKNMVEEETILHNLTFAINQFYTWYWKIVDKI